MINVIFRQSYLLSQFTTIFFEPKDEGSRAASKAFIRSNLCTEERSQPGRSRFGYCADRHHTQNPVFPSEEVLHVLKTTTVPILHIGADHEIVLLIENWYALNNQLPTLHLTTYPRAGHGPHRQIPEATATQIAAFIMGTCNA